MQIVPSWGCRNRGRWTGSRISHEPLGNLANSRRDSHISTAPTAKADGKVENQRPYSKATNDPGTTAAILKSVSTLDHSTKPLRPSSQPWMSGVNYFFGLTTTISPYQRQLLLESSAARSARRRAKPACGPVSVLREKPWRWESGKTCFWFFHFSIRPRRRSCGNVGISPAVGEISKGLVERGGSLLLAFHAFHSPGISTALFPGVFCFGRRPQTHSASPWLSAC